ncbi:hypothetical protein CTEN210_18011 [Chaetoceros tenuissimus]|uniref:Fe2OG dioxygenase domain-containing protein n=1 Tax=Chaetoceros tenuissimus TaxID=426638 RepID=A0AAD3HFA9_9STRA|nr:hypothetical protein CTEN210_18011 [Chaetoceros tenuissimus]
MTQNGKVAPFAGEEFLAYIPPSHIRASRTIVASSVILFVIIFYVIPRYIKNQKQSTDTNVKENEETRKSFQENRKESEDVFHSSESEQNKETDMKELLELFFIFPKALYAILIFSLILFSPQNHETARRIFQSPMLRPHECKTIIEMAESVATRKYREAIATKNELENQYFKNMDDIHHIDKLLQWPEGWSKDRHGSYPTTDLNLATDFDQKSKRYIQTVLDARVSPLLERIYGITQEAIRADDMFLVRYDGNGQQHLARHRDGTIISINILLNGDFEGGGTKFFLTEQLQEDVARPRIGEGIIHNSVIEHEGLATTKGTRYILVGFLNVDRMDSRTGKSTNVGIFSTFFCFHWMSHFLSNRVPEFISTLNIHEFAKQILIDFSFVPKIISKQFNTVVDSLAPFGVVKLVQEDNYEKYLDALDRSYEANTRGSKDSSNWFEGNRNDLMHKGRK